MTTNDRWLDDIDIASPCPADWTKMQGDERCRFCSQCKLHVFDLSALTRPEAVALVQERSGRGERLCVRFRRRADGTVLTQDCPVGLRQRVRRAATRIVAACSALLAFAGCRKPDPDPQPPELMGEICIDPPEATQPLQGRIMVLPPQQPEAPPK